MKNTDERDVYNMTEVNLETQVRQEELLDISIDRVTKLNAPLLVIGLGGTGADIVRTVKRIFAERFELPRDPNGNTIPVPPRTAYLVIDTDTESSYGFQKHEYLSISLKGIDKILDPERRDFNLSAYERTWVNRHLNTASHGYGAGTYRQASRFMLSRQYQRVYSAIREALNGIITVQTGTSAVSARTEIVVATGICGGTGSGTFLDIPQIIRHCMQQEANFRAIEYKLTGYIAMPDVSLSKPEIAGNAALTSVLQQNGFAALKELDFWMQVGEHRTPYAMEYSGSPRIPWDLPPYDYCILLSGTDVRGTVYDNSYAVIQKTVAENLLHYLAQEQESRMDGQQIFTYISYENNLQAIVTAMHKRLPLFYGYRAVGAYIKRIPKKKLLYYEGGLLFNTFVPPRDNNGYLVPNAALLQDGQSSARARRIVGEPGSMYTNFKAGVRLPPFCSVTTAQKEQIERLRALEPAPHERRNLRDTPWLTGTVLPASQEAAVAYLDAAWQRFTEFISGVITDPEKGPFSLLKYLEDKDNGLMPSLEAELVSWKNHRGNFSNQVGKYKEDCNNTWKNFKRPPAMAKRKAEDAYLQALVNYYDSERKSAFMEKHVDALEVLVRRVRAYRDQALTPLCRDLEFLHKEFDKGNGDAEDQTGSDIFSLSMVKDRIDETFHRENAANSVTAGFLSELFSEHLNTEPNVDSAGPGLTFLYRNNGINRVLRKIRNSLNVCFGVINSQSLDAIMMQSAGNDTEAQNTFMDRLGASVIGSAQPLFAQDPTHAAEDKASFNYLSVPDNAPLHLARYQETLGQHTTAKGSSLQDHMYCTSAWDGLPLYRYNQMSVLERTYSNNLRDEQVSKGLHLVWEGDRDSDYTRNWIRLPSPSPYFYFAPQGEPETQRAFEDVRVLTHQAIECGMLSVRSDTPVPSYSLHLMYDSSAQPVLKASDTIRQEVLEISREIDPRTGDRLSSGELLARLRAYLNTATKTSLSNSRKPDILAPAFGLQNQPCDPWSDEARANPNTLAAARKNHERLSRELASALIYSRPHILLAFRQQIDGIKYARDEINKLLMSDRQWEPRILYAPKVADMLMLKVIFSSLGWKYRSETGENTALIQPALLSGDLTQEGGVVQAAAHLGDLAEDNLLRIELENQLKNIKDSLQELANSAQLSKEKLQEMIDQAKRVMEILQEETRMHRERQRRVGADRQREGNILQLLAAMERQTENEIRTYTETLRTL